MGSGATRYRASATGIVTWLVTALGIGLGCYTPKGPVTQAMHETDGILQWEIERSEPCDTGEAAFEKGMVHEPCWSCVWASNLLARQGQLNAVLLALETGCERECVGSCLYLADIYFNPENVPQGKNVIEGGNGYNKVFPLKRDIGKALALARKACKLSTAENEACSELALYYRRLAEEEEFRDRRDALRAKEIWAETEACKRGCAGCCRFMARKATTPEDREYWASKADRAEDLQRKREAEAERHNEQVMAELQERQRQSDLESEQRFREFEQWTKSQTEAFRRSMPQTRPPGARPRESSRPRTSGGTTWGPGPGPPNSPPSSSSPQQPTCKHGRVWINGACQCPDGTHAQGGQCVAKSASPSPPSAPPPSRPREQPKPPQCTDGKELIKGVCKCPSGTRWKNGRCEMKSLKIRCPRADECVHIAETKHGTHCNDPKSTSIWVVNRCDQTIHVRVCQETNQGKWMCGGDEIPSLGKRDFWVCDASGRGFTAAVLEEHYQTPGDLRAACAKALRDGTGGH